MLQKPLLTIFTPTYNRKELLLIGYEALKRQSNKNFIWLIIDDGSNDHTRDFVEKWKKVKNGFTIDYYYQRNEGLHSAYNYAIHYCQTELITCIDSDDYLVDSGVEKIINFWQKNGSYRYAGIVALNSNSSGKIIGGYLPSIKSINLIDLLIGKYKIKTGDRKLVVRTDLYKTLSPMKIYKNEKFYNPNILNLQISNEKDFLVFNQTLCIVNYQANGMGSNMFKQYANSPNSFIEIRKLYLTYTKAPFLFKAKNTIHLISSCLLANDFHSIKVIKNPIILVFFLPFSLGLLLLIKIKSRKRKKW